MWRDSGQDGARDHDHRGLWGKSTIARRQADEQDLHVYATGEVISDHANRSTPQDAPLMSKFKAMDMDQRWIKRTPQAMLETFHWSRQPCGAAGYRMDRQL